MGPREDRRQVVLAVDIGGTKALMGLVDRDGQVLDERRVGTRGHGIEHAGRRHGTGGDDARTDTVDLVVAGAADWLRADAATEVVALAAGFPEYVDGGRLTSQEVIVWQDQPRTRLATALARHGLADRPVAVESDVRLGALGEARFGAGADLSSFLYVSLGTGLSSTLVLDGRCWPGHRGRAIALGEWPASGPVVLGEVPAGNLERYVSGAGISRRFLERTGRSLDTRTICAMAGSTDRTDRTDRTGAAGLADRELCQDLLRSAGAALGSALAALSAVLEPEAIVLGGGLGSARTPLRESLHRTYTETTTRADDHQAPRLLTAGCGDRSALLGAAAHGWDLVAAS